MSNTRVPATAGEVPDFTELIVRQETGREINIYKCSETNEAGRGAQRDEMLSWTSRSGSLPAKYRTE